MPLTPCSRRPPDSSADVADAAGSVEPVTDRAARPPRSAAEATRRSGFACALGAYGLWGFLPVYFLLLEPSGPFEIVGFRIFFSLVFCAILLTATRRWRKFAEIVRDRRLLFTMALAGALIYVNWQVYIYAATSGRVLEGSLGYFINPIVTVLLGVLVLHERLRPAQWVAVGISVIAVLVLAVGYGQFPLISLTLAFSFGFYGLIKKRVSGKVDAISGLSLETAWLTPVAAVQLGVVAAASGLTIGQVSPAHTALAIGSGVITAVPLLLFAAASSRLPLVTLGFVQYLAPLLQFAFGAFILKEAMPPERWLGFSLVWVALAILITDAVRSSRAKDAAVGQYT